MGIRRKVGWLLLMFLLLKVLEPIPKAQSPAAVLAPTGTLRAVFLSSNPVHARVDPRTGVADGPVPDLVKELARTLGVQHAILPASNATAVIDHFKTRTADIGFLAYDETRAREVEFGPPFAIMLNSYLVRSDSSLRSSDDVDRAGLGVGAVRGQTQQLFISRKGIDRSWRPLPRFVDDARASRFYQDADRARQAGRRRSSTGSGTIVSPFAALSSVPSPRALGGDVAVPEGSTGGRSSPARRWLPARRDPDSRGPGPPTSGLPHRAAGDWALTSRTLFPPPCRGRRSPR